MHDWKKILEQQDISPRYLKMDFKNHPATKPRWNKIIAYGENPKGNVFMSGSCGNGKTVTAVTIFAVFASRHGLGCRFYNAETLYPAWLWEAKNGNVGDLSRRLSDSPLLILDDLGQGDISDGFKRWLYSVINRRWEFEKPLVCTTNLKSPEFRDVFGDAIFSRLLDGEVWKFEERDHRLPGL